MLYEADMFAYINGCFFGEIYSKLKFFRQKFIFSYAAEQWVNWALCLTETLVLKLTMIMLCNKMFADLK